MRFLLNPLTSIAPVLDMIGQISMVFLEARALQSPMVSFRSGGLGEAVEEEQRPYQVKRRTSPV
jgi:hypothetical protein